ncbi:helix-turn-helix domain-containing protein [Runella sp. CRIBMP]|uniref:helix-turn-helix domain-containing protein n=1 Tax=Runella sp. CRIBMP TaxID=2683261 RepID=UPI001411F218|nr:helix-turn-helix domain-containing protein [Runella sp. CRIBMP]NBB19334.1 helix-turn-helix domain-containing protein [Runella sp. CRIBMP]
MESFPKLVLITPHELEQLIRKVLSEDKAAPQSRQHAEHEYLNMAEASKYLQLPQNTLYVFCHERRIPYSKRGKRNYFLRADLDEWMASHRKMSAKEIEVETMANLRKKGKR